jgi:hypothetical protein
MNVSKSYSSQFKLGLGQLIEERDNKVGMDDGSGHLTVFIEDEIKINNPEKVKQALEQRNKVTESHGALEVTPENSECSVRVELKETMAKIILNDVLEYDCQCDGECMCLEEAQLRGASYKDRFESVREQISEASAQSENV